jgi:glutaredoxin
MKLVLYTTLGCHLCEQVERMLDDLKAEFPHKLVLLDIANDDALLATYATEIPVLFRPDIDMEFAWPFEKGQLRQFLSLALPSASEYSSK